MRMTEKERERLESVGISPDNKEASGRFLMTDQKVELAKTEAEGLEVMSIRKALEKYDWLHDYYWKSLPRKKDEYTRSADSQETNGYFIRALPGARIKMPVEACLFLKTPGHEQKVHNIVIAEEGSELNIISGCTSHPETTMGLHIGISEFYVKKNAKISFTMIHRWSQDIEVFPRSAAVVEENGLFVSNYFLLEKVKKLQAYPVAMLNGKKARALFNSVVIGLEESEIDMGSRIVLNKPESSGEIVSRSISKGGKIIARGNLEGNAKNVKGHLECKGLLLSPDGDIVAIPELEARHPEVELSHEASIGKIAEEEIYYLMTRGMTRDEAVSTIIRGFMEIETPGLPPLLKKEIDRAISLAEKDLL